MSWLPFPRKSSCLHLVNCWKKSGSGKMRTEISSTSNALEENMYQNRHKKESFQRLKLQDQVLQFQHQLEVQRQNCLQFEKLQMRSHADQAVLEQVQGENQRWTQQVASLKVAFMALQKMEKQDLLAKKEALNDVQEGHVFLESEIKSPRNMPEGENRTGRLSSEISIPGSIALYSTTVDGSRRSSDMSSTDSSHPASVLRTTDVSSRARSADLTQAFWRRAIAQPKGHVEISNWNPAPSRNLHLSFADQRKIAQSLGFMDSHGRMHSVYDDYQKSAFSAVGNLKIAEVHSGGLFVKILNCAPEKEESIGDYLLMQNIQGQPVAVFRFPPKIRMVAGSAVTVWAADAKVFHKPPSDFLWKDLKRFRTGLSCATILCEPNGQAVAWYTPLHCSRRQGWVAREERENLENIIKPSSSTTKQKEGWEKEQEPTMTDTEWKRADPGQTRKKSRSFIKREEKTSASLFLNQSAWCQSPDTPTHPHFSLVRPLTMGNDGSSLCRQSRCQSARPDSVPGTLYAGTSQRRNPSAPSCVSGKDRRRPTRSAGPNFGGVMYVGSLPPAGTALQKYFVTPSYSFMLQTHHFLYLPAQNL